jgi:type I restriction enzyme S subunit
LTGGTNINNLKFTDIENIEISLPPLSEQKRIIKILDETFEKLEKAKKNTEKNLQNSKELFESYLNDVFSNPGKDWEEKGLNQVLEDTNNIDPTKNPKKEFMYLDVSGVDKDTKEIINIARIIGDNAPSRARKQIQTGDVVFATVRPTHQRVAIIPENLNNQICSTGYMVLRTKNILNNKLLFYCLLTRSFNQSMERLQKGASYPAVTETDVKRQVIYFPKSLNEQKQIAKKLEELSEKTKKLESLYKQKLANIEELKKSILQKGFSGEL